MESSKISEVARNIARKAWQSEAEGRMTVEGTRVVKDKKMVTVVNPVLFQKDDVGIVVFPHPSHFEDFERATKALRHSGPAQENPGSVGSLALKSLSYENRVQVEKELGTGIARYFPAKFLSLRFVQAHYTTTAKRDKFEMGEKQWEAKKEFFLKRSLATRYAGWRRRALSEAIQIAAERQNKILIDTRSGEFWEFFKAQKESTQFRKELEDVCQKLGATVEERDDYLVINPRVKQQ